MRAGAMDRKITIQRKSTSQDSFGQPIETWASISHRRSAAYRPMRGDERYMADQFIARQQVEFRIRYSSVVSDLNPLDRIIYPAPDDKDVQSPDASTVYEIMDVPEVGRREGFLVRTARRSEQ